MRMLIAVGLSVLLMGCGGGSDGGGGGGGTSTTGGAYAYVSWTSDVVAADFTEAGVPSPFYSGTRYRLKLGPATLYWGSNWLGGTTYYYLPVTINGGTATQDRVYNVLISQDTLYVTDSLVPIGTASVPGGAVPLDAGGDAPALDAPWPAEGPGVPGRRAPR